MIISHVVIQNYRKLKCCRISFSEQETIFVGANNSGKTSAMDALIYFLDRNGESGKKGKICILSKIQGNRNIFRRDRKQYAEIEMK
jgi:recombinational DNA repair ATPase RecF